VHLVYSEENGDLKLYNDSHALVFTCAASNATVNYALAWRAPDAGCPPGTYTLGEPEPNDYGTDDYTEMGAWFIPVLDVACHVGIGIHSNGRDNVTQLEPTMNCFRVWPNDLATLVAKLPAGGAAFTVVQKGSYP
jgi:hypothetical protein